MHLSLSIRLKFYLSETQPSSETIKSDLRRARVWSLAKIITCMLCLWVIMIQVLVSEQTTQNLGRVHPGQSAIKIAIKCRFHT